MVNMELHLSSFVTFGLLFVLMLVGLRFYWNVKEKCLGFPFVNIVAFVLYDYITGKISKDVSLNHVLFQKLTEIGKMNMQEGLFMTFVTRPMLFIFDGEAINVFLKGKAAADVPPEYTTLEHFLGNGLVTSNGERWKKHRKMINPVFHMQMLREKVDHFNEHGMALVEHMEKLADTPTTDILGALKCHYFYVLIESILGLKANKENQATLMKFAGYVDNLTSISMKRTFLPWLRSPIILRCFSFGRQYYQQLKDIDDFVANIICEMKEHVTSKKSVDVERFGVHLRKSFTYRLLQSHIKDPSFSLQDLHSETKTIIGAGYDTVSYTTMWCLFLLGLHPEIQEKAFNEILSTTSDYITYEESCSLVYLESVIMETLRLYPTIPVFGRNVSEDFQFGKYKVLKDTTILIFPYLSHRDPKVFPNPEKFDPERFLSGDLKKSKSFIPFSEGTRNCIGKNYALIELKVFLSHILRNFQIASLDRREDIDLCASIVLMPAKPLRMKITRRHVKSP